MQLVCPIPTIHFKPVENKKKSGKGTLFIYLFIYSLKNHFIIQTGFMRRFKSTAQQYEGECALLKLLNY